MKHIALICSLVAICMSFSCRKARQEAEEEDRDRNRLFTFLLLANQGQDSDPIGTTIEQSLDASTSSMESITSDGASVAFLGSHPNPFLDLKLKIEDFMRGLAFPDSSLMAATFTSTYTCLGGGTISRTIEASSAPFTGTGPSSFFGRRVFNDCILLRASRFLQNGNREVYWDQLATTSPYLQIGSNLKVALNRTITDRFRSISVKVVGTGERITSGNERIASQATWSAVSSSSSTYSVTITESRIGSNSRGATIFDHSITTPTALVHTVSGTGSNRRRTINGSVKVSHNILKFDTLTTFKDVVWDASTCKPVSGEATVVITGSRTGGGTINFSTDSASYSYSGTSGSSSGTVEFTGCTTNI